jgi:hypothetical protein
MDDKLKCKDCKYFISAYKGNRGGTYGYCELRDQKYINDPAYHYGRMSGRYACLKFEHN